MIRENGILLKKQSLDLKFKMFYLDKRIQYVYMSRKKLNK